MITLYQFPVAGELPNFSPFCMKVETYLRMTGHAFEVALGDIRKAPKGKLPYIEDGAVKLGDSALIIDYLKATYGDTLDAKLTPEQLATAHLARRTMEESLYFAILHARWSHDESWEKIRAMFAPTLPAALRPFVPPLVRRSVLRTSRAQGTGRHTAGEIATLAKADLDALSVVLGDHAYFLGDEPTTIDATAYAFLGNVVWDITESPLKAYARGLPNVRAYCERMRARYYAS